MIVSILNQKGGVGKTTLSVNLARQMALGNEKVLLVDSDPQGSARDWHAEGEGKLLNMVGLDRPTLHRDIENVRYLYDWIFIDGAPGLSAMAVSAIKCSDIILIPVQPSPYDLWATEDLIGMVSERIAWSGDKVKAAFVVSRKIANTKIGKEILDILQSYRISHGITLFQAGTVQRVIYATSAARGLTVLEEGDSGAIDEINAISEELRGLAR